MGTKLNPGTYDCYANLKPDEPFFVLKSTDPLAPILVDMWAELRALLRGHSAKVEEAEDCATAMRQWYGRNVDLRTGKLKVRPTGSAESCGCDPGANHRCELHGGNVPMDEGPRLTLAEE